MSWLAIYVRGLAMGAADVVPGVSGGTVAFITGIYQTLLDAIGAINLQAINVLRKQGVVAAWSHINGNFLLALLLGILTSILSLARVISYLLASHPLLVWSFFFGLILASSVHMLRQIKRWRISLWFILLFGVALAVLVTELKPSPLDPSLWVFFMSGAIAICAMILPGISGSFILVLLGMYQTVLLAVKGLQLPALVCFAAGCAVGLLSFSRLLSWLFQRYQDATLALLTGFLIGSLNLVWPWKQTLSYYQSSQGEARPLEQANVLPVTFARLTEQDPQLIFCLGLAVAAVLLVFLLEIFGQKTIATTK